MLTSLKDTMVLLLMFDVYVHVKKIYANFWDFLLQNTSWDYKDHLFQQLVVYNKC